MNAKIFLFFFFLLSCSGETHRFGFGTKNSGSIPNITLPFFQIIEAGQIEQGLIFTPAPGQDLGAFQSYQMSCLFKTSPQATPVTCSNYGDNAPQIEAATEKLKWDISSSTPNGVYEFTIQKVFENNSLSYSFSLNITIRTPFISKWLLNPDKVLSLKLSNTENYNFIVNWGDGSAPEHITTAGTTISHTYTNGETEATVTIHGELPSFINESVDTNDRNAVLQAIADYVNAVQGYSLTATDIDMMLGSPDLTTLVTIYMPAIGVPLTKSPFNSQVLEIIDLGDLGWKNMDNLFAGQSMLTKVSGGNLSQVISMNGTFLGLGSVIPVEFNTTTWNLENLQSAKFLFQGTKFAPTSNLSGMRFSPQLKNIDSMFERAQGDLATANDWDFSGVTDMKKIFYYAVITNLNTSSWNTQNVENLSSAFEQSTCISCNFSGLKITNKTTITTSMFNNYAGPSLINMNSVDMSEVTDSSHMFEDVDFSFVSTPNLFKVLSKNKNVSFMFTDVTNIVLDTSDWNTTNVENFTEFFSNVDMDQVNTSGIVVTSKATSTNAMFFWVDNLTLNTNAPGKVWNTSSVIDMGHMFSLAHCKTTISCNFSRVIPSAATTNMSSTFAARNEHISGSNGDYLDISNTPPIDTSLWNTSNVTNFANLFYRKNMAGSNLSGLIVTDKATTLDSMFNRGDNLVLNTSSWDISNVTDIDQIFERVDLANTNLSGFIPSSKLVTAYWPFRDATNVTLDTSAWDISGLKYATDFFSMVDLVNVNLSGFNPGPAMEQFNGALYATRNGFITTENWDLSNSVNISQLFAGIRDNVIVLKNIDLASISNKSDLFGWRNGAQGHLIIEGTTTDPGVLSGDQWFDDGWNNGVWCPDWSGTSFGGFTCDKNPYPY